MKAALTLISLLVCSIAQAETITLPVPNQVPLANPGCAYEATLAGYKTIVSGFSLDENYVIGMDNATYACSAGRGYYLTHICATLVWDLAGNLVDTSTTPGVCPTLDVSKVFTNAGGYMAETLVYRACGKYACYATYYYPTLVTP